MDAFDIHFHVIPAMFLDSVAAEALRPALEIRENRLIFALPPGLEVEAPPALDPRISDPAQILAAMDRRKLARIAVSPPPQLFTYWTPPELGAKIAAAMNNAMAALHRLHPLRIHALATVPLQNADYAAAELHRAVTELALPGVAIGSNVGGTDLDDPQFAPFLAMAERLDVPVFIHPQNAGANARLQDFHLWNVLGFPMETATAAARLIMSGVLDRHPRLKIILAHGGGFLPYQLGRLDHAWQARAELRRQLPRAPSSYLANIYCDSIIHHQGSLRFLIERFGTDHIVLGTDYPFDMGTEIPVDSVLDLQLNRAATDAILGGTLAALLRTPPG